MTPNTIEIFAPGKLMIFGEYGVLRGGKALLIGVDRGVTLRIEQTDDAADQVIYQVPALADPLHLSLETGDISPDTSESPLWPMLRQVLRHTETTTALAGHRLTADLSQMTLQLNGRTDKLGLGSSAASCVALTAACRHIRGQSLEHDSVLQTAFDAHHAFQGGRGSGADVATSVLGNAVAFHLEDSRPVAKSAKAVLPAWSAFWTGQSANTRTFIDAIRQLEGKAPTRFAELMAAIRETAANGVEAALTGKVTLFLDAIEESANHLRSLGEAARVPIVTRVHEMLGHSAAAHGFKAKPSGAGGGDFSLVFGADANALEKWTSTLDIPGVEHVPLAMSRGVHVRGD